MHLGYLYLLFWGVLGFSTAASALCQSDSSWPPSEEALIERLRENLDDTEAMECLADRVDSQGFFYRARFLREVAKAPRDPGSGRPRFSTSMFQLLEDHYREIAPGLPETYYGSCFAKAALDFYTLPGFIVVTAKLDAAFVKAIPQLLSPTSPIFGLHIPSSRDPYDDDAEDRAYRALPEFLARPELARLVSFEFFEVPILHQKIFLECPHMSRLRRLVFGTSAILDTRIALPFVHDLPESPIAARLKYLYIPYRGFSLNGKSAETRVLVSRYFTSTNLASVRNSPLIHPGINSVRGHSIHLPRPYISQVDWELRFEGCAKKLTDLP